MVSDEPHGSRKIVVLAGISQTASPRTRVDRLLLITRTLDRFMRKGTAMRFTSHWKDIGKFKGPVLRGLAARPPYFHNGLAVDLGAVVDFYNTRFAIGFTEHEKADLVAFSSALQALSCARRVLRLR
jgi:cytochrome c peroxidase